MPQTADRIGWSHALQINVIFPCLCLQISLRMPNRCLQKRIRRYSHIICRISGATILEGSKSLNKIIIEPPLLPTLLAACAPTAQLTLHLDCGEAS